MQGKFINYHTYDFPDPKTNVRVKGQNMNCLVKGEIVKVKLTDEEYNNLVNRKVSFGTEIPLDVEVRGKFANYTLSEKFN